MFIALAQFADGSERVIRIDDYVQDHELQEAVAREETRLCCVECGHDASFRRGGPTRGNLEYRRDHFYVPNGHRRGCDIASQSELDKNSISLPEALENDFPIIVNMNFSTGYALRDKFHPAAKGAHPEWKHEAGEYTTYSTRSAQDIIDFVNSIPDNKKRLLRFHYQGAEIPRHEFFIEDRTDNYQDLFNALYVERDLHEGATKNGPQYPLAVTIAEEGPYALAVPRFLTVHRPTTPKEGDGKIIVRCMITYANALTGRPNGASPQKDLELVIHCKTIALAETIKEMKSFSIVATPSVREHSRIPHENDGPVDEIHVYLQGMNQIMPATDPAGPSQQNIFRPQR
ncbi:MAG: hypothetical protein GC136_08295 [Alphaproteobacteria bacterium]|nr:hypothetical protein [Alphaproteobacteria bacterium]